MSRSPKFYIPPKFYMWLLTTLIVIFNVAVVTSYFWRTPGEHFSVVGWLAEVGMAAGFTLVVGGFVISLRPLARSAADETQARQRVRQAEDKLSGALRSDVLTDYFESVLNGENDGWTADGVAALKALATHVDVEERREDRLTLAALWDVTHGRMDLYHQIVTRQARRSFGAAQVAMGIGFVLLVVFAVVAVEAKTTAAAISAGGLGAVGAAFAAYIGKTFIRSQESAASHLKEYFTQPLELSRYLAAERLLADAKDLTAEQRAAILSSLVQSIATAGQHDDKTTARKPRGRRAG